MLPELLTLISPEQAAQYILDDRFWLQQKRDGVRLMIRREGSRIRGWNKQGQPATVEPALARALLSLNVQSFVLDGEFERQKGYHCWDLLRADNIDLSDCPYGFRYQVLQAFAACPVLKILPSWTDPADKEAMLFEFHRQKAEGVVFKNSEARFRPGRANQHYKLKFEKSATCRVREVDPIRNRVGVEMLDGGIWIEVCGLKVLNGRLRPGQFVEVKYLYGTGEKRLVQPRFVGVREDVSEVDCSLDQVEIAPKWTR
jgi:bifunctional non-homologous end joining protein LigD